MGYVALTKAALGEKVPAKPPDSFQATRVKGPLLSETNIPMSWLTPAFAVHRSEFAPSTAVAFDSGDNVVLRLAASIGFQVTPSESACAYCCVLIAKLGVAAPAKVSATSDVGENLPPMGPAPA